MDLCKYVNSRKFASVEEIKSHFSETFGVDVKSDGSYIQFCYGIDAKFSLPITHQCRGHILYWDGIRAHWASRPFDKFFNRHEGFCPVMHDADYNSLIGTNRIHGIEKVDGTCIHVWWDVETGSFRASTLGCITPLGVNGGTTTFDKLFWDTIGCQPGKLKHLNTSHTYIFELATPSNAVVTRYNKNRVVLLGARSLWWGMYEPWDKLDDLVMSWESYGLNVERPAFFALPQDPKQLQDFVEKAMENPAYGELPEGIVIYRDFAVPIAKVKSAKYVTNHHFLSNNAVCRRNMVAEAFFGNYIDDLPLRPEDQKVADEIAARVLTFRRACDKMVPEVEGKVGKELALILNAGDKQVAHYFFALKGNKHSGETFAAHLKKNWLKLENLWKIEV